MVLQMTAASGRVTGVVDGAGTVISCSELSVIGEKRDVTEKLQLAAADAVVAADGFCYKALYCVGARFDYAVFVQGEDDYATAVCGMASISLNSARLHYDEKYDKSTFVKYILQDNILPGDIYIRSRELRFDASQPHAVFLVRQIERGDVAAVDVMQSLFPDRARDFVISLGETELVLIKEVKPGVESRDLLKLAAAVEETLKSELMIKTVIGIGSVAATLKDLAAAYKEAQIAIEVGKVFDTEKSIINYENLGIGRLIYQLPTKMCEMFLAEVFKKNSIDSLDRETLETIHRFFENNLNVSETSRKLFVHRNTLVYRLEKIKKLTGLDLREFDHAIVFKVALMVKKYLTSWGTKF
jgi:carbohydrate diacid regulator